MDIQVDIEPWTLKYDLEDRLIDFAVMGCRVAGELPDTTVGRHVASQLIRSATSPAPNYGEAQAAESRRDFIHKLKISLKELRETKVWLKFVARLGISTSPSLDEALKECDELVAIFVKSIKTTQEKKT